LTSEIETRILRGPAGDIAAHLQGPMRGQVVVMSHSILSSSMMWEHQAKLLAQHGFRVVRLDTRGHGGSRSDTSTCTMDDLADDIVVAMDALDIAQAHYVGLSLGGMSGFGLGIRHADRLLSLCICDARADAPPAFAAPWDERIAVAQKEGSCAPLASPTIERWFGKAFVESYPAIANRFLDTASKVQVAGFVACARAIQQLNYLGEVGGIALPLTMIVGRNDAQLPQAMLELQGLIPGSVLETIDGAGHLPNIDQQAAFDVALLRHFSRVAQ
jgi:3-oxoadipate enol-lactonase